MTKTCKECPRPLDAKGARGMCHACYEKWRYQQNPDHGRAINRRSNLKNKPRVLAGWRAYRAANLDKVRASDRAYSAATREQRKPYMETWRANNPDKMRDAMLRKKFGITLIQYNSMLESQNGRCAICREEKPGKGKRFFCVDHSHRTGTVRGLLCSRCNQAIGIFEDDIRLLNAAAAYLEEPNLQEFIDRRQSRGKVLEMAQ